MKKSIFLLLALLTGCTLFSFAQKDTLSPAQTKALMATIKKDPKDLLKSAGQRACKCIDSIDVSDKLHKDITKEIGDCIDKEVVMYDMMVQFNESLTDNKHVISINTDKTSQKYKEQYYDIEKWLKDSCAVMNKKIASNDKLLEHSNSNDAKAREQYNTGIKYMNTEEYGKGLPYFKKAVEIDPEFAFAWDNLAICYRKTGELDKAIEGYKKSLALDPKGVTPLHNLPVVYELKEDYDKALEAYKHLSSLYPDDPEAYYGAGRIYHYFKIDLEKALDYMCKAYNAYISIKSPYRVDAEQNLGQLYTKMKAAGKEDVFDRILKENNISTK